MEEQAAVGILAALAQPARLRVFRALIGAAHVGMTPGSLAALLDLPASTLSFHLKGLTQAGLVSVQRDGRSLIYRPDVMRMNALLTYLTAHCCHGAACTPQPTGKRAAQSPITVTASSKSGRSRRSCDTC